MQGVHLRKYGVAAKIDFVLYEVDGVDFRTDWTPAEGDVFMIRDEAAEEQITNAAGNADLSTLVTDEGRGYSITLALEDMEAARVEIFLVDQATKAFLDWSIVIETYGHASAQHAFDLDAASVTTDSASRTASKATGFSTHNAAAVKSAIEAEGSHLTLIKAVTDELIIHETTIASVTDDKTFVLTDSGLDGDTSADDDAWNDASVVIEDVTGTAKQLGKVADYGGVAKQIVLDRVCKFNLAAGDKVKFYPAYTSTASAGSVTQQNIDDIVAGVYNANDLEFVAQGSKGQKIHHSGKGR